MGRTGSTTSVPASFVILEYVRPKYACFELPASCGAGGPAGASHRQGTTGAGAIGTRGRLQIRRSLAVVSARADLRAPRRTGHPAHALGVERGSGRLTGTARARHAPGAGAPVVVDSMDDTTQDVQDRSRAPEIRTEKYFLFIAHLPSSFRGKCTALNLPAGPFSPCQNSANVIILAVQAAS
jgi:hypothetical protein